MDEPTAAVVTVANWEDGSRFEVDQQFSGHLRHVSPRFIIVEAQVQLETGFLRIALGA